MSNQMLSPVVRIVDDDASVCESQSFFLQLAGFRTRSFSSAEDFLRDDDAEAPGCIILDVRMGGMTGIELQQELNRRGSDLPIIFLSAHGDIEMAMSCVEAGAFNFLVKPPEPEKLQSLVTKAVEKNRMERRQKAHALNLKRLFDTLTTAEKNISYQLAKGLSNPQIAKLLGISERTVQTHRARVYGKLDIENPVELNDFLQNFHCGILVVGAGGAGLAAALEASAYSDSVVLIEKESFIGGDTLYSGGFFNAPNTEFQNRKGIKDSEEFYLQQITRSANGRGNPKVQTKLAKEAANTLNWLRKNGVTFGDEIYQIYGSGYRRSHKPVTALGSSYVQNLAAACLKNGVSIRTSTRLESFEVLPNQRGFRVTISSKGVSSVITSRALDRKSVV